MANLNERKDLKLSLKFGFLGLGMGGSSIAAECARIRMGTTNQMNPYTALLINTNEVDLNKIKDGATIRKLALKGYEKGAGRSIELGEEAFKTHIENITTAVNSYFLDREFVWVVCGLGGGTGTGSIIEAIRVLYSNGFKGKFGLILTLPRDQEGSTVLENALERLQVIEKAMQGLGSILVVDNQKLYNDFIENNKNASVTEYLDYSNKFIAQTLHEFNVVTASFNPTGAYHFDSSEFLNAIRTPGVFSISKVTFQQGRIDTETESTYLPEFRQSIVNGILSNGYNLKSANRIAVSMVAPPHVAKRVFTIATVNKIEETINELAPLAGEKPVATYADNEASDVSFYSIITGLSLPKRVAQMVEVAQQLNQLAEEQVDSTPSALSGFSRKKKAGNDFDLNSVLSETAAASDTSEEKKKKSDDPFAGIL